MNDKLLQKYFCPLDCDIYCITKKQEKYFQKPSSPTWTGSWGCADLSAGRRCWAAWSEPRYLPPGWPSSPGCWGTCSLTLSTWTQSTWTQSTWTQSIWTKSTLSQSTWTQSLRPLVISSSSLIIRRSPWEFWWQYKYYCFRLGNIHWLRERRANWML